MKYDTVSPLTPHFRKIVLSRTLSDNKLRIPKDFMKKHGGSISNPVLIKVPGGKGQWKMGLADPDENGDTWLAKGWPEFAKHYDLEEGQSLIFKYKGHSEFKIVIIGKCGYEIDYPKMPSLTQQFNDSDVEISREEEEEEEEEEDDDDYDFSLPRKRMKEEDDDDFSLPRKRMKKNPRGPFGTPQEIDSEDDGFSYGSMSACEKAKALSRTKSFVSLNPFFKVVIQETHLHGCSDLIISPEFWVEHLKDKSGVTLYIPTGEKWPVKINTTNMIGTNEVRASFKKSCWKEFAEKNDLQIGDVCIFELITGDLMKVSIYRNSQKSQEKSPVNKSSLKNGMNLNASKSKTKHSSTTCYSFNVELRESSLVKLYVPFGFAKAHFGCESSENLELKVGKLCWPVRLTISSGTPYFSAGWRALVKDNNLSVGDSCLFELANNEDEDEIITLKVTVSRSNCVT